LTLKPRSYIQRAEGAVHQAFSSALGTGKSEIFRKNTNTAFAHNSGFWENTEISETKTLAISWMGY